MFAYELRRRALAAKKNVQVFVCHPVASRTNLRDSFGLRDRILWGIMKYIPASRAGRLVTADVCYGGGFEAGSRLWTNETW